MKRFSALFFAFLLVTASLVLPTAAAPTDGLTFAENESYPISRPFEAIPLTFEAWVYVPTGDSARQGTVIGNYEGGVSCVNFEITTSGRPRLYVVDSTKTVRDYTFSGADVRTGDWTHVAIVYDSANDKVDCYINGTLRATKTGAPTMESSVIGTAFALAGDNRSGNAQYFKNALRSVSLFTNARTADEIKADMEKVKHTDPNLLAHYDLTAPIVDDTIIDDGNGMYDVLRVRTWFTDKEPVTDYAYAFCVVGDTQKITINEPDKLSCIYDFIVANKDEKKIAYVFGLGDITDKDTAEEWAVAKTEIGKLDGVVPYSLVRGNHDSSAKFNAAFGTEAYRGMFEGFLNENKLETSYTTFTAGGVEYLHITLDYGPTDAELAWACEIVEAHPDHRVILSTHAYLFRDGTTLDENDVYPPRTPGSDNGKNNGDDIWEKLAAKYENIFLVLSGHDPCSDVIVTQTKGVHGNVVTQMLIDPQGVDAAEGATGLVAMLYFGDDGRTVSVEYYSTVRDQFFMSTSQMEITVPAYVVATVEPEESETETETETLPESEIESETDQSGTEDEKDFPKGAYVTILAAVLLDCILVPILIRRNKRSKE